MPPGPYPSLWRGTYISTEQLYNLSLFSRSAMIMSTSVVILNNVTYSGVC
jgi:hypothetical protein